MVPISDNDSGGRPRDPAVDARILTGALRVFARQGWFGASIDAVAREAGVSKASIYLRWENREQLVTAAVASVFGPLGRIDNGDLRSDLVELARVLLELYAGEHGLAARRMTVEAAAVPALAERWQHVRAAQVAAARRILQRAVDRGEWRSGAPVGLVLDTLCGAAILQPVAAHDHLRPDHWARRAEELVDFVLAAASATPPHGTTDDRPATPDHRPPLPDQPTEDR